MALAASDGRGAVLINPSAVTPEIEYQLADASVGAVFTVAALVDRLPAGTVHALLDEAPAAATVVDADGVRTRIDLGSHFGLSLEGDADAPGRDEECAIVYTSAMAGRPLGAILTHRNLLANARGTVETAAMTADDHTLALLPWTHLFGLVATGIAPLVAGGRVTTMPRFHPGATLELIERAGVTVVIGVPPVFVAMLGAIAKRGVPFDAAASALRLCLCGGAPLDAEVQRQWERATGRELRQGYGLTEASPVALANRLTAPNRLGSLGVPFPGVQVSVRDPERGTRLPAGTPGELCVSGPTVFRGYVSGGADGLQVSDGWLHTGDRGVEDADGSFTFLGLIKSMFTRNGFNIYPREIEQVVGAMPGVRRARVVAIPEPSRGSDIGLTVDGDVSEAEVKAWCAARLSAYKQPTLIEIASA